MRKLAEYPAPSLKERCVFAETIVITENGARRMHSFPTEFQRLPV